VPGLDVVVPKFNVLNQLPVVKVGIDAPLVRDKFGLLVAVPPVVPNTKVLVLDIIAVNPPPVAVYVNPVAVAILNTVVAAVVCANTMLLVPNVIARVFELFELNIPVVKSNPFRFSVPLVNVVVAVASANANWSPKVVVPVLLIVNAAIVLVLLIIVPVPTIVAVRPVYVPVVLNVKLFKFKLIVPGLNVVVPKLSVLNQLPVVRVVTNEPEPVSDKFGLLVAEPPVVLPNVTVLVTDVASVVNPPVPVRVNPVAVAILKTVVAAVG